MVAYPSSHPRLVSLSSHVANRLPPNTLWRAMNPSGGRRILPSGGCPKLGDPIVWYFLNTPHRRTECLAAHALEADAIFVNPLEGTESFPLEGVHNLAARSCGKYEAHRTDVQSVRPHTLCMFACLALSTPT